MTQCNTLNKNLSNSQLNMWIITNSIGVTLNLSWNVAGDSNDETNFPSKSLLNTT